MRDAESEEERKLSNGPCMSHLRLYRKRIGYCRRDPRVTLQKKINLTDDMRLDRRHPQNGCWG
jgi:hypothetical protein